MKFPDRADAAECRLRAKSYSNKDTSQISGLSLHVTSDFCSTYIFIYSRTSMAQTPFGSWKIVRAMGSSSQ